MKVKLDAGAFAPTRAYKLDAGYDLRSPIDVYLPERGTITIDTGVHMEIPEGYVGHVKSKSGLYINHDITADGLVDAGFTGSIKVKLVNHSNEAYHFRAGDKITQMTIMPVYTPDIEMVDELEEHDRGENGYGSTGR